MEPLERESLTDSQQRLILRSNVISLNTDMARVRKTLFDGDGERELPLVERVRNLENYIGTLKFWSRTIAVALVLQTITFGVTAIIYFAKLYPIMLRISQNP